MKIRKKRLEEMNKNKFHQYSTSGNSFSYSETNHHNYDEDWKYRKDLYG